VLALVDRGHAAERRGGKLHRVADEGDQVREEAAHQLAVGRLRVLRLRRVGERRADPRDPRPRALRVRDHLHRLRRRAANLHQLWRQPAQLRGGRGEEGEARDRLAARARLERAPAALPVPPAVVLAGRHGGGAAADERVARDGRAERRGEAAGHHTQRRTIRRILLGRARRLVQARKVDEHADHVRAERVAQEAQQRAERRAVRVGVRARAPRVAEEAHASVGGAQRGGSFGGREKDGGVLVRINLEILPARERVHAVRAQGVGV
jgi:hypothetical protein